MDIIYSKIQPRLVCHLVIRAEDFTSQRIDVTEAYHLLQLALLKLPKGKTFKPHRHIPKKLETNSAAQEMFICIKGQIKCKFYDIEGSEIIAEPILNPGDASLTLAGGHNYEMLEDNTIIYEIKSGPYLGVEKDKTFIE